MPRIARQTLLDRFRAKIAAGQPLIGGGAGTGLSAKCEEAGGIDLIVIYNSGRYRMAGRGLAGRPAGLRQRQRDRLRDGARGAAGGEAHAGAGRCQRHRPVHDPDQFLRRLIDLGFSGVQNFPTVGLIDGTFRANLEETGMSYGAGGRD
jgi:predicted TIM-barrel enzyme